jgi:predicted Zn finger-like uncharacterized protein
MRIRCPDCDAFFDVPDDKMRPGRSVRCARCHSIWTPVPESLVSEGAAEEDEHDFDPPPTGAERMPELHVSDTNEQEFQAEESWPAYEPLVAPRPEVRETDRSRMVVLLAWMLSLAVLGGVVGAGYVERSAVMRLWPPSQRVYQLVGLQAEG